MALGSREAAMKRRTIHLFGAAFVAFAVGVGTPSVAFAGPATNVIKSDEASLFPLLQQLRQPPPNDAEKKIDAILDQLFDYPTLAQGALGSEWAARSDAEKTEFTDVLKKLVRTAYEKDLKKILDMNIAYTAEQRDGADVVVKTSAKSKTDANADPVELDFRMSQAGGAWKLQDIIAGGVSLVGSYRSEFTKIIKAKGFAALIQAMKDRLVADSN
jgi:phospholipid transport system substrate-binding protein